MLTNIAVLRTVKENANKAVLDLNRLERSWYSVNNPQLKTRACISKSTKCPKGYFDYHMRIESRSVVTVRR